MSAQIGTLPASAVRVSAHCRHCKADIETDGSNRCPDCGAETLPESRGIRRIVALNAVIGDAALPETGGATEVTPKRTGGEQRQPVLIRARREAAAWHAARAKLLAALEREEAAVLARYEAARAELQQIRRERSAISQDCGLIAIDGAMPTGPAAAGYGPLASGRAPGAWPVKVRRTVFEACADCGTTDSENRPHRGQGRCEPCFHEKYRPKEIANHDTE
jgi:hypothetical protein